MSYRIKDVVQLTGVTAYTLRYYEKEGILPSIERDDAGRRVYSDDNLFWLDLVTCLKKTKMPVTDIKEIVRLSIEGDDTIEIRKNMLEEHRLKMEQQINDLQQSIVKIDKKIAFYNGAKGCKSDC